MLATLLAAAVMLCVVAPGASALPEKFFGQHWGGGQSAGDLEAVSRSGAKYFHLQLSQTTNVAQYDEVFKLAWERGVTILPYLYGKSNGDPHQFPSQAEWEDTKPGSWTYFVYEIVHRYGFQGDFWSGKANPLPAPEWEVWNEPNLSGNNPGGEFVQPENYTRFAKNTAISIQNAQLERSGAGTRVNFGNLFSAGDNTFEKSGTTYYSSMKVDTFLNKSSSVSGALAYFTGIGLHPYSFAGGLGGVQGHVNEARSSTDKYLSSVAEIWITELGWPVGGAGVQTVSEAEQASLLTQTFDWIKAVQGEKKIQSLVWYNNRDVGGTQWDGYCGLRDVTGGYRPAWWAYIAETGAAYWPTPTVNTGDAPETKDTQTLVTGTVNPNGSSTSFRFEYGKTTSYGQSVPVPDDSAGSGKSDVVVTKTLSGLDARSHYHYRLVATNAAGTAYGGDRTFTTGVKWLLRNSNSAGDAEATAWLGLPGSVHLSGDWNGDGVETPGSYDPSSGTWRLSNSLNTSGKVDIEFQYGGGPWKGAVAGDWNKDGADTIGTYDPQAGNWNLRNSNSNGAPDIAFTYGGGVWKTPVAGDWNKDGTDTIGVYDPSAGNWNLRNTNSGGSPDISFQYGGGVWSAGFIGDWNKDGTDTIGIYDPSAGNWNLRNTNSGGSPDISFQYGGSQFGAVVGDWNGDGTTTAGLTDGNAIVEKNWLLRNANSAGVAELGYLYGFPGEIGVVGDWNGDGFKTLGTYDPVSGVWRLSNADSNRKPDLEFAFGGGPWSKPIVGDWNKDGTDTIGVYDPSAGNWNLRNTNNGGSPDISFQYGGGVWKNAVAGDWNKDGTDTIGVYDPSAGNWNLRNTNSNGAPDIAFQFGGGVWNTSLAGDWNNDGTDTIGVYDPQAGNWNLRNTNSNGAPDISFQYGGSQFQPIVGDWDGNGTATAGLIASNGEFTSPAHPPVVTTQAPTVAEVQATLKGSVNPNGFSTRYHFEWGATTSYGNNVPVPYGDLGMGTSEVAVSQNIKGLLGDTTYHYRVVAESAEGKRVGADESFKTPPGDGTAENLAGMAVVEPFNGGAQSLANFNSNWGKLGWAPGKGEDTATGWRPVAAPPTVQGAFGNLTVSDEKGAAVAATMAVNPGGTERYLSLWLDMGSPTGGTRSGYELRFTYVSANTYSVNLSKWSSGTQTVLATKSNVTFANGNSFALVDKGTSVSGWTDTGSGYSQLLSQADSTFSSGSSGVEGVGNLSRVTKFKFGSLLPNTASEPGTTTTWNLRNSNSAGAPDLSVQFGVAGQKEVVGDWDGNGTSTFGTFDGSSGIWKLRNYNSTGPAEIVVQFGGGSYSTPIVGDWNGDGVDSIGAFDPSGRNWNLRNSNLAGSPEYSFQYGGTSAKPISGNWDGIGADGIGVYYPSPGNWDLRHCICGGNPDYSFQFGGGVWSNPIAGNWDGVGADGIGVFDPSAGNWNLRHCMCGGNPDYSYQYGGGSWKTAIAGDWDGNGTDTPGVAND